MKEPKIRFKGFQGEWKSCTIKDICEVNPKSTLPSVFEYVDLESVVGTEMVSHRTEKRESAPSRAQRVASKGDIFYQTVRPYQKNNYLFDKDDTNYVFSTGYAQLRTTIHGGYLFTHGLHELQNCTSVWADTCLFPQSGQQRRSERSNASATRNNRPCCW